jgi:ion channel POLLUX/CASTOR
LVLSYFPSGWIRTLKILTRQPLLQIWEDILGFENAEFYIKQWPELDGMRFGDVLISFPDAVPCGVKVASKSGKILMNPDDGYVLREGDEVLVIAEDDDTYAPAPLPEVNFLTSGSIIVDFVC